MGWSHENVHILPIKSKSIWVQTVQLGVVIFNTGLNLKVFGYKKTGLERWWSILYIYAIFPKVPNFYAKVFSKSTHPPLCYLVAKWSSKILLKVASYS